MGMLLFLTGIIVAQSTMEITGNSAIEHKPTQTVVSFSINVESVSYESVLNQLNMDINGLNGSLKKLGFQPEEIITRQFSISKNRKYVNGGWKDEGYLANQMLIVVFPIDKDRLVKVLKATTGSGSQPEINISFTLDDAKRRALKEQLIIDAVLDAKMKADLIASTADQAVIGIEKITYASSAGGGHPQPMYKMAEARLASDGVDFSTMEGESITLTDQVHILFKIGNN